jgi:hypothetical protein
MPSHSLSSLSCRAAVIILPESLICSAEEPSPSSIKLSVMAARVWPFCDQKTLTGMCSKRLYAQPSAQLCGEPQKCPTGLATHLDTAESRSLRWGQLHRLPELVRVHGCFSNTTETHTETQTVTHETQNGDANVSKFPKFQVFREEAAGRSVSSTVSAGVRRGGAFGLWPLWMLLRCMVTHTSWAVPSCAADVVRPRTCMDVVAHTLHALCCNRTHGGDVVLMARC